MITNIQEHLNWLNINYETCKYEGFKNAHNTASSNNPNTIFTFDNDARKASKNSAIASLSDLGKIDLEAFRQNDSPYSRRSAPMTNSNLSISTSGNIQPGFQTGLNGSDDLTYLVNDAVVAPRIKPGTFMNSNFKPKISFDNNTYSSKEFHSNTSNNNSYNNQSNNDDEFLAPNFTSLPFSSLSGMPNNTNISNSNTSSGGQVNSNRLSNEFPVPSSFPTPGKKQNAQGVYSSTPASLTARSLNDSSSNTTPEANKRLEDDISSTKALLYQKSKEYIDCLVGLDDSRTNSLKWERNRLEEKLIEMCKELRNSAQQQPFNRSSFGSVVNRSMGSIDSEHKQSSFSSDQSFVGNWDDMPNAVQNRANCYVSAPLSTSFTNSNFGSDDNNPACFCGLPSVSRTSKQERSLNRLFYVCSKDQSDSNRCSFFQWADESISNVSMDRSFESVSHYNQSLPLETNIRPLSSDKGILNQVLRRTFGHTGFREGQKECIDAAMDGRDVFCLMPTGGGKSIVYQLPALCSPGLAVVFSPLLSLIIDQVDLLSAVGVRAAALSSSNDDQENQQIMNELFSVCHQGESSDQIKLLYITPERFSKSEKLRSLLRNLVSKGLLSRFVIDEAHCLSQWGHDFRPDYLSLASIRVEYPTVPIMCLTATANQAVVRDSMYLMKMSKNSFLHTQSFNRKNLTYEVKKKVGNGIDELAAIVLSKKHQSGIIYCFSRKDCETTAESLRMKIPEMRRQIDFYHADLPTEERSRKQGLWSKGDVKVLCATIAFGMGINKPDVRYVIHHTLPKSLTNYYQESGRAGRDGAPAECILLFSYKDKAAIANMIVKSRDSDTSRFAQGGGMTEPMRQGLENLRKCVGYCMNDSVCRRVLLLEYFGEKFDASQCHGTCDNCRQDPSTLEIVDFTEHAINIIRFVRDVQSKKLAQLTISKIVKAYTSSKEKDSEKYEQCVKSLKLSQCQTPIPSRDILERVIQHMVLNQYLDEESVMNIKGFSSDYVILGSQSSTLESGRVKLQLTVRRKHTKGKSTSSHRLNSSILNESMISGEPPSRENYSDEEDNSWINPVTNMDQTTKLKKPNSIENKKESKSKQSLKSSIKPLTIDDDDDAFISTHDKQIPSKYSAQNDSKNSLSKAKPELHDLGQSKPLQTSNPKNASMLPLKSKSPVVPKKRAISLSSDESTKFSDVESDNDFEADSDLDLSRVTSSNKSHSNSAPPKTSEYFTTKPFKTNNVSNVVVIDDEIGSKVDRDEEHCILSTKQRLLFTQWLQAYRKRWDKYWIYMNNQLVELITKHVPNSIEELANLPGVGENRARHFLGEHLIATIYSFLEKHGLLKLFPDAKKPTIEPCPTWQDPSSDEAKKIIEIMLKEKLNPQKTLNFRHNSPIKTQSETLPFASQFRDNIYGANSTYNSQYYSKPMQTTQMPQSVSTFNREYESKNISSGVDYSFLPFQKDPSATSYPSNTSAPTENYYAMPFSLSKDSPMQNTNTTQITAPRYQIHSKSSPGYLDRPLSSPSSTDYIQPFKKSKTSELEEAMYNQEKYLNATGRQEYGNAPFSRQFDS